MTEQINQYMNEVKDEALALYNAEAGTAVSDTDPEFTEFVTAFVTVTLAGWAALSTVKASKKTRDMLKKMFGPTYATYEGIEKTTNERIQTFLEANPNPSIQDIQNFAQTRSSEVTGALFSAVMQGTRQIAAQKAGKDQWVGGITMKDNRVRDKHRRHHKKYWRNDGSYEPWLDYNDRCSYMFFATEEEARAAGFTPL